MIDQYLTNFNKIITKKRLSHLYLLSGERGSGKTKLAFMVAYEILKKGVDDNKLKNQIEKREYPNLLVIEPEKEVIKKEQILFLQEEFNKTALIPGPRVYIIMAIDQMTISAANSLLKFMEEPQNQETYGFLLTERKENVIPTILSRSQIVNLHSNSYQYISEELIKIGIPLKQAKIIPLITKDLNEAIKLSVNAELMELIDLLVGLVESWNKDGSIILYLHNKVLLYDRIYYGYFLDLLVILFLDIIHIKTHQKIVLDFLKEEISLMSTKLDIERTNEIISILQNNINEKRYYINLEMAIINLAINLKKDVK